MSKKTKGEIKNKKNKKDDEIKRLKERIKELEKSEIKRKQDEAQIQHLNLILRTIRNVNQLVIREKNRYLLIQKACEILTENSEYDNAWIVLLDEKGKYLASAEAGLGKDFTPIKKLLEQGKWTKCGKRALKQKKLIITEDPEKECRDCPLSQSYAGRGGYSVCLRHGDTIYGLLTVSVLSTFLKNEVEQELFQEVSGDIGFALHSIEIEQERKQAEDKLQTEKDFSENLLITANVFILTLDINANITLLNKFAEKLTGYKKEEVLGRNWFDLFIPKRNGSVIPEVFNDVLKEMPEVSSYENPVLCKNGSERLISWENTVLKNENGEISGILSIGTDITERKQAEKALKESEKKHRTLIETTSEGFWLLSTERKTIDVNQSLCDMLGYSKDEMIGKTPMEFVDEENRKIFIEQTSQITSTLHRTYEISLKKRNGINFPTIFNATSLVDENGNPAGSSAFVTDITKHKQAEEALKETEDKYRALIDDVLDTFAIGTFILDSDFKIVWINRETETFFGLKRDSVIGKDKRQLIQSKIKSIFEDSETFQQKVFNTYDNNTYIENFECHVLAEGDRKDRWLEHWSQPIKSGIYNGGRIEHYSDITKRKEAEEELEKHRNHLEKLVKERTAELEEANKELRRFNKLFVGREFRIKELKDKVKDLEKELTRKKY